MRSVRGVALAAAVTLALSGCSALGGEDPPPPSAAGGTLRVAVLTVADIAPLQYAVDHHLFGDKLTVQLVTTASGNDSVARLRSSDVDIAFSSYSVFFLAEAKDAADLRIISDASAAPEGRQAVVTVGGSSVKTIHDLAGKRIAISARNTMSHLLTVSALHDASIDLASVHWAEMPFDQMGDRLQHGDIDAAYIPEPFLTIARKKNGVLDVFDPATGPNEDIPLNGYAAMSGFINAHRDVVQAFQWGMRKAAEVVAADRALFNQLAAKAAKTDVDTLQLSHTMPTFVAGIPAANRIRRVPALMAEFDALPKGADVDKLVADILGPSLI